MLLRNCAIARRLYSVTVDVVCAVCESWKTTKAEVSIVPERVAWSEVIARRSYFATREALLDALCPASEITIACCTQLLRRGSLVYHILCPFILRARFPAQKRSDGFTEVSVFSRLHHDSLRLYIACT